jgi:PIN domain nuclease of toxin-antitoxin system
MKFKLLLDTHTFIWWDSQPAKLSHKALALCQEPQNTLLLSVASIWEMQIKLQLGKLKLNLPLAEVIESQRKTNNIEIRPITLIHVLALESLPNHHKDPFDRLLIAQASVENAFLVSCDPIFAQYPVNLLW